MRFLPILLVGVTPPDIAEHAAVIQVEYQGEWRVLGGATVVEGGFLTAAHILGAIPDLDKVRVCDIALSDCVPLEISPHYGTAVDYLFLETDASPATLRPAKIAWSVQQGEPIHILGCPSEECGVYFQGHVARLIENCAMDVQVTVVAGMSGSGIFNDNGRLVGIVSGMWTAPGILIPDPIHTWGFAVDLTC